MAIVADRPLQSLRDELESILQRVQFALETYMENPAGKAAELATVIGCLNQVRGVLVMLDQPEAAALAAEMGALAQALADDALERPEPAREALLQALLHLPRYLEWLQ
ncbi:MAG: hypothetical protein M3Z21_13490, partial [Pseudomonadota bacterium]|nr:hypothetical protein [Pseudomonadota bacterium]